MQFDEYQRATKLTAIYPGAKSESGITYTTLGLIGEAGELANDWKKSMRDGETALAKEKMRYELGDVLWYLARLADELGMSLDQVAQANLDKLRDRKIRNQLTGSGDNR